MRVLVAYGSERGGTAGLAQMIGEGLRSHGVEADARAAREVWTLEPYTAVIVAGSPSTTTAGTVTPDGSCTATPSSYGRCRCG